MLLRGNGLAEHEGLAEHDHAKEGWSCVVVVDAKLATVTLLLQFEVVAALGCAVLLKPYRTKNFMPSHHHRTHILTANQKEKQLLPTRSLVCRSSTIAKQ